MGPWKTAAQRRRQLDPAEHKGRYFAESSCELFIESSPWQARVISQASGKPVLCPAADKVFC
jgi:hypothetical protein